MTAATVPNARVKDAAMEIVRDLPDDATWEDVQYSLYVREKIERGLADIEAGRVVSHEDIKRKFGITS
jgi:predicted transcriptional regulator